MFPNNQCKMSESFVMVKVIFLIILYSPGSAHTASKTAETFETLGAERFPPHSGFFQELADTNMIICQCFIIS